MWPMRRGYPGPAAAPSNEIFSQRIPAHEPVQFISAQLHNAVQPTFIRMPIYNVPAAEAYANEGRLSTNHEHSENRPHSPCEFLSREHLIITCMNDYAFVNGNSSIQSPFDSSFPASSTSAYASTGTPRSITLLHDRATDLNDCDVESSYNVDNCRNKSPELCTVENLTQTALISEGDRSTPIAAINSSPSGVVLPMPQPSERAYLVASMVIKHARDNRVANERDMGCMDCGFIPVQPVTGLCGHTRCTKCITNYGDCPCGAAAPEVLHVNTLVQNLTNLMQRKPHAQDRTKIFRKVEANTASTSALTGTTRKWRSVGRSYHRSRSCLYSHCSSNDLVKDLSRTLPMLYQCRFDLACELLATGRFEEAAPHFAHVAACPENIAKSARTILAQIITILSEKRDTRRLTRELYHAVRLHSASNWLKAQELECILCCDTLSKPVTTPCGHTYCRTCLERSLDYKSTCALCLRSLEGFNLATTKETLFISAALTSINAVKPEPSLKPDEIRIFVCTVAFPEIPCPLFIFDPRYWMMIRRVLESDNRRFGMVASEGDRSYSDYGTVMEIRDCVHLEDGRCIVSTIGVSRFRIIEKETRYECDIARIQPLADVIPTTEESLRALRAMASQISKRARVWLNTMEWCVLSEIEATFGKMPQLDISNGRWCSSPDGPACLWWLIGILPLRSQIKVLILSTDSLLKRMMAVSRILEAVDHMTLAHDDPTAFEIESAIHSNEPWLARTTQN